MSRRLLLVPMPLRGTARHVLGSAVAAAIVGFVSAIPEAQTCTYSVSPTTTTINHLSQSVYFSVTTQTDCVWDAPHDPGFVTRVGSVPRTGSGTIAYYAAPNASPSTRATTFTIAGQSVTVNQAASGAMAVSLTASPSSPQPAGTSITLTAVASGGTISQHLDYRWWLSTTGGGSWSILQDWTYAASTRVWTPPAAGSGYFIVVNVRQSDNYNGGPEGDGFVKFVATAPSVSSVTVASDRPSPQVTGAPIRWTATATGGVGPLSYKWLLTTDAWATSTVLQDWTVNANTCLWTPTAAGSQYQVGVWVRSAGNSTDAAERAAGSSPYVVTAPASDVLVFDTFTGPDTTLLSAHPPDINGTGASWTYTGGTPAPQLSGGRAAVSAGSGHLQATINAGISDIRMGMDVRIGAGPYLPALAFRLTDADNHLVLIAYQDQLQFYRKQAGAYTMLAAQTIPAVGAGSTHRFEVRAVGSTIEGWWDGALIVTTTSSFQQTATRHGIDWNSAYDAATTYDNFELRAASPAPASSAGFSAAGIEETVSVPNGWGGNLTFSSTQFDTSGFWNSASPARLTVPAGARYVQVGASIELPSQCTVCQIYIMKNDAVIVGRSYGASANRGFGGATFTAVAPVVRVATGDFFTTRVFQDTGAAVSAPVRFSIHALDPGSTTADPIKLAALEQTVTVPNGWGGNLTFSSALFDTAGFWSTSMPGRLSVPAGVSYAQAAASIDLPYQCTVCQIYIMKNDAVIVGRSYGATANTGFGGATFTALAPVVRVAPGDFFTVRVYMNIAAVSAPVRFSVQALDHGATTANPYRVAAIEQSVSVPNGWGGNLAFSAALFDSAAFWSAATPTRLTVPAGVGHVQVAASIALSYQCTVCQIYLLKNDGAIVGRSYGSTADTEFGGVTFTAIAPVVRVAPGDFFTVRVYQNTGAAVSAPVKFSIAAFKPTAVVTSTSLTANRPSPQPPGTAITWTTTSMGGGAPLSYKWRVSTDGSATWSVLQDWTPNATSYVWTPQAAGFQYRIGVWARSAGNPSDSPEASSESVFGVAPLISSPTLSADRLSPQPTATAITWMAAANGGIAPLSYKWLLSANGGATWSTLRDWTANGGTYVWTPQTASSDYRIGVWVRSSGNTADSPEANASAGFVVLNCTFGVSPTETTLDAASQSAYFSLTTQSGCPWNAPAGTGFVTRTSAASGTGSANISYFASANTTPNYRSVQLVIAGTTVTIGQTPPGPVTRVDLLPDRLPPQVVGRQIKWTAFAIGGAQPLSYRWMISDTGGGAWDALVPWTPNANTVFWTPNKVTDQYRICVGVRGPESTSNDPQAEQCRDYSTTAAAPANAISDLTLTSDRPTPQVVGTSIAWTATPTGGTQPYSYKWWLSNNGGASWSVLQDWTANASTRVWTPQAASDRYWIGVWVRSAGNTVYDGYEQSFYSTFVITSTAQNQPPIITAIPDQGHVVGRGVSVPITGSDPELAPLTYTLTGQPPGITVNSTTGVITGAVGGGPATYTVTAGVSDGVSTATHTFRWSVTGDGSTGVVVSDHFTEPGPTLLRLHVPDLAPAGSSWLVHQDLYPTVENGRLRFGPWSGYQFALISSYVAEGRVGVDLVSPSTSIYGGLAFPDRSSSQMLLLVYRGDSTAGFVGLYRWNGASVQLLQEVPVAPLAANTAGRIEADFSGTQIEAMWNGAALFTQNVTSYQPSSSHGVIWHSVDPLVQFDRFEVSFPAGAPIITGPGNQLHEETWEVSVPIRATDPLGANLTYSATGLPPDLVVNANTGVISGQLTSNSAAIHHVVVRAAAGSRSAQRSFQWLVRCPPSDYQVSMMQMDLPNGGGTFVIPIYASAGCPWETTSNFVQVTSGSPRFGSGELLEAQFWIGNNPSPVPQAGLITVAGNDVALTQRGEQDQTCTFSVQSSLTELHAAGGSGRLTFTPDGPNCQWVIGKRGSWITLIGPRSGVGAGHIDFTVGPNEGTATRNGWIFVNGHQIHVEQAAENCPITVSANSFHAPAAGDSFTLTVTAPNGCGWQAVSATPQMLEVTENPDGNGTMPIRIRAFNNPGGNPSRIGYVDVNHIPFLPVRITVTQAGTGMRILDPTRDVEGYYHTDAIGSVRMITDAGGQLVGERLDYLPFGEQFPPTAAFRDPRMFAGKERDQETTLDYFGGRYYLAASGRFITTDPVYAWQENLIDPQRWIRYSYVRNNPLRYVDPDGRIVKELLGLLFGLFEAEVQAPARGEEDNDPPDPAPWKDPVAIAQIAVNPAKAASKEVALAPAKRLSNQVVLGRTGEYAELADKIGARHFFVPTKIWGRISDAERWTANQKFLDRAIARGDDIVLATPITKAKGYFAKEIQYLWDKGYRPSADGTRLLPPVR